MNVDTRVVDQMPSVMRDAQRPPTALVPYVMDGTVDTTQRSSGRLLQEAEEVLRDSALTHVWRLQSVVTSQLEAEVVPRFEASLQQVETLAKMLVDAGADSESIKAITASATPVDDVAVELGRPATLAVLESVVARREKVTWNGADQFAVEIVRCADLRWLSATMGVASNDDAAFVLANAAHAIWREWHSTHGGDFHYHRGRHVRVTCASDGLTVTPVQPVLLGQYLAGQTAHGVRPAAAPTNYLRLVPLGPTVAIVDNIDPERPRLDVIHMSTNARASVRLHYDHRVSHSLGSIGVTATGAANAPTINVEAGVFEYRLGGTTFVEIEAAQNPALQPGPDLATDAQRASHIEHVAAFTKVDPVYGE